MEDYILYCTLYYILYCTLYSIRYCIFTRLFVTILYYTLYCTLDTHTWRSKEAPI